MFELSARWCCTGYNLGIWSRAGLSLSLCFWFLHVFPVLAAGVLGVQGEQVRTQQPSFQLAISPPSMSSPPQGSRRLQHPSHRPQEALTSTLTQCLAINQPLLTTRTLLVRMVVQLEALIVLWTAWGGGVAFLCGAGAVKLWDLLWSVAACLH